jgi:pilus assembly protein CpaF
MLAGFAGFQGTESSLRRQIANAVDFIVQIGRLSNGRRRIQSITEVTGLSDTIIATQELYRYEPFVDEQGEEVDNWVSLGIHPHSPKLARFRQVLGGAGPFDSAFERDGGFRV